MRKTLVGSAALVIAFATLCPVAVAQLVYQWDGDVSSDWSTTNNWHVFGGNPLPGEPFFDPPFPDETVRVEIAVDGMGIGGIPPAPVIDTEDALALQVRIGRSAGAGKLTINGGSLSTGPELGTIKFRVANGANGTLIMNGGALNINGGTMTTGDNNATFKGQIIMTGGSIDINGTDRDLNMDEFAGSTAASNITMSAGTITIADVLLVDNFASIDLSGGSIIAAVENGLAADGAIRIRRDGEIRLTGGLLESKYELELGNLSIPGGTLKIDGGLVRVFRFGDVGDTATIMINGSGLLQVNNSQSNVAAVQGLIDSGLIMSSGTLGVSVVNFSGVDYTQVALLAGLAGDYNENGEIDAADYTVWRDAMTAGATSLANDPTPGTVNESDFVYWRDHYGDSLGSGAGLGASSAAVPEPASFVSALMAAIAGLFLMRRRA